MDSLVTMELADRKLAVFCQNARLSRSQLDGSVCAETRVTSVYILSSVHSSIQHLVIDRVALSQWSSLNVVLYM